MCCFSRPVKLVADTNIFARSSTNGRQFLVFASDDTLFAYALPR